MQRRRALIATWHATTDAATVPGQVRDAITETMAIDIDLIAIDFMAALIRPPPRVAFVVVLSDRILTGRARERGRVIRFADLKWLGFTVTGDLILRTSDQRLVLFGLVNRPPTAIVDATCRAVIDSWQRSGSPGVSMPGAIPVIPRRHPLPRTLLIGMGLFFIGMVARPVSATFSGLMLLGILAHLAVVGRAVYGRSALSGRLARLASTVAPYWGRALAFGLGILVTTMVMGSRGPAPAQPVTTRRSVEVPGATAEQSHTSSPKAPEADRVPHGIFDLEVHDVPLKTQVSFRVTVPPETTRSQLDTLMRGLYRTTAAQTGFRYHARPTSVYVYVFYDEDTARTYPAAWIGSVQKAPADSAPSFVNHVPDGGFVERVAAAIGPSEDPQIPLATSWRVDGDHRIHIVTHHTGPGLNSTEYAPKIDVHAVWFAVFWPVEQVFLRAPDATAVQVEVIHRGKTLADVTVTGRTWKRMKYAEEAQRLDDIQLNLAEQIINGRIGPETRERREAKAERQFYARCLARVPAADKKISGRVSP